ncbi:TonB-dependent receptor [Flavivirga jejuensis]|uniref:Carboxypeptidase regulatory-like domain-containing protein n=1 Tax=Flavivirga jejuensis TaxID=870487 RepID=A0ABT8WJ08_9FLAO|nr:TonB-dependent receptor [Flavivirga jejuensis]MDO5973146.1 carboxypeptidase regulatory-like domain-containing protein [Flavivirga jejuensis]
MKNKLILIKTSIRKLAFIALLLGSSATAFAQNEAEISGTVKDIQDNEPITGANIIAVNSSTGFKAGAITDFDGNFVIRDLQLGGPYTITVSYIGYQTITKKGYQLNLGDKLKLPFNLTSGEALDELVIVADASRFQNSDRLGAALSVVGKTLEKIPTTTRNYEDLANLSPLSTPNIGLNEGSSFGGISVAGSNGGSTGITLDGVNNRRNVFGGTVDGPAFSISLEAIREFEIVTNEYDVSGPRGSGGSIKAVTKSGSNDWSGAVWYYGSGGSLSGDKNFDGSSKLVDFNNNQFGARVSGPIIKDKLNFIAVYDQFTQESPVGAGSNSAGFINFNSGQTYPFVESDVQNYVDELVNLGVLENNDLSTQIGELGEEKVTKNIFLRMDWNINDNNNLSLRYNDLDYTEGFQAGSDGFDNVTLFSRGYPFLTKDKKVIASLKSRHKSGSNDLRVSYSRGERVNELAPGVTRTPRISVGSINNGPQFRVGSGLATWVPEEVYFDSFQFIDVLTKQIGNDTYTFGTDILITMSDENIPHNIASSFRYDTLEDLQNGTPFFFNKKFANDPNDDGRLKYTASELALFAQGEYNLTDDLELKVGIRWDGTIFNPEIDPTNPNLNSIVFRGENIVNNSELRDFNNIQPRVSITWDKKGEGKEIFKFGMGFFASQFTTQPYTSTLANSGSRFTTVSTTDPTALATIHQNFVNNGGFSDLDSQITAEEYAAATGVDFDDIAPDVVILDPDFDMPVTFKANLSYHRFFNNWFRLGGSLYYNNTKNVPYYNNINLQENGTNPLDGRVAYTNGASPNFGNIHVFQNSDWKATFFAASLEAYARLPKGGNVSVSYTKSASKGFSYYNAGGGIEDGKPISYAYNSYPTEAQNWHDGNSIPNKLVFSFVTPEIHGFTLSGSLVAGQFGRFTATTTPNANGNVIGGLNLAYIPTEAEVENTELIDPNTNTSYNPYEGFNLLLASTSPEFREYINKNRGEFADFNGGIQPWAYTTNMSLIKSFTFAEKHKISLRMDIFNVLNLFDYKDGSFDVVSNTNLFNESDGVYSVNPIAGKYNTGGDQFRMQFGLKYEF